MPMVGELNDFVLRRTDVWRDSEGGYHLGPNPNPAFDANDPLVSRVQALIGWCLGICSRYYRFHSPNYEDVFYVIQQVHHALAGEYDNPALSPLIRQLDEWLITLNASLRVQHWDRHDLLDLAAEAENYAADIVTAGLSREITSFEQAQCLVDAVTDKRLQGTSIIATLNNDLVIEATLGHFRLKFCTGFDDAGRGVTLFSRDRLFRPAAEIQLLKLHGSVGWKMLRTERGGLDHDLVGTAYGVNYGEKVSVPAGEFEVLDDRSRLLIGTHNKIIAYSRPLFFDMRARLLHALHENANLIIAGYGFADKGINEMIIQWLHEDPERRAIVVTPSMEKAKAGSRGAIEHKWEKWLKLGRMVGVESPFSKVSWADLSAHLA